MISLIATITAKEDKVEQVLAELQILLKHTTQEEGNIQYVLHRDIERPNVFVFYEQFKDQAAFDFHASQSYIAAFGAKKDELLEKPAELKFLNFLG
jgi:quinol monooxygenase YgiN